jgi:acetyltransferase-like isoleucine patch superfamily enzyme
MSKLINSLSNLSDNYFWILYTYMSTFLMKLILSLKGVEYTKNIKFYGMAKFKMAATASILVGKNCSFRSKHTSNLIGINRPCIITALAPGSRLTIGNNCGLSGTVIGCVKEIRIGNNVKCGANTLITDTDWHPEDPRSGVPKAVYIHDNVWLGVNVVVLKGVTIGENSLIGAGSVVVKDIPANVIAGGNPCKILKNLVS